MDLIEFNDVGYCVNCDMDYVGSHTCSIVDIVVDKKIIDIINNMEVFSNDVKCECGRTVKFENRFKHRKTIIHKKLLELKHRKTDRHECKQPV